MTKTAKAYGSWTSPVTADLVAAKGTRTGHMQVFQGKVYWLESRPEEKGRGVLVCFDGEKKLDVNPTGVSIRSKVHEYGGGDFLVSASGIFYCDEQEQAICRINQNGESQRISPLADNGVEWRFADFALDRHERVLFAVRESHEQGRVINDIVALNLSKLPATIDVIASGKDFYSYPRISPDGNRICWTCWDQPNMPWDGTELWVADLHSDGSVKAAHCAGGGQTESIYQPSWSPDGVLHFISDRSGWWSLYSFRDGVINALTPTENDFGLPQWVFGTSTYCFGDDDNIYATYFEEGQQYLAHLNTEKGHIEPFALPFREYPGQIHFDGNTLWVVAGAPVIPLGVFGVSLGDMHYQCINNPSDKLPVSQEFVSLAKPVSFTSAQGEMAHAYFYEPRHPDFKGLDGELPPLIVLSHSGPTSATTTTLSWAVQFWTSRGFAVIDVNYAGSTGFGREYRQLLNGQWGIADVNDCVYAARYLVEDELVDGERLAIRGGSAGGFTTLCALTFFDDFAAGMTRYGVADLEALTHESHKFEARYLDSLVGPYPEAKQQYIERSPIHNTQQLSCPILVLQGSDDKVVPPSQAQKLVDALKEKDIPHAYIEFAGEGHGFRQKDNIIKALEAELSFYRHVFGIQSDEQLPPLNIQ